MKKILTTTRKVRFQDCDPFNHLNNASYIDYFLNAREDQLMENYNLDIFGVATKQGLSWVVASNQIQYIKPAFTMETILIDSQLIAAGSRSLLVEMRMWDEKQTHLKAVLWSNFIHFDLKTQKSAKHGEEFSKLFTAILLPVEQTTFEDRRDYLIRQRKE
jgi:YbgC/YbaW family acyl-CoA thioester hydrolase